jgi:hypothetical protein
MERADFLAGILPVLGMDLQFYDGYIYLSDSSGNF